MEDNLYNLEEDESAGLMPKEETTGDIDNGADAWKGVRPKIVKGRASILNIFFKILTNPVPGWRELKRSNYSSDEIASRLFYPLLALVSLSKFMDLAYDAYSTIPSLIIPAVLLFISFFFGYFFADMLYPFLLPKGAKSSINKELCKRYLLINISSLALCCIIFNIVPMLGPVIAFMPLLTIYTACKGVRIFETDKSFETQTAGMMSFLIIACPLLWFYLLTELMPLPTL